MRYDQGWKDLAARRAIYLVLFYKIVNYKINVPPEGILKYQLSIRGTWKSQAHNKFINIGSNIDDYKYYFYPHPSNNHRIRQTSKYYYQYSKCRDYQ